MNIFWFRRDLRLDDNEGLYHALMAGTPVLPVFIFDTGITGELEKDDARISFIYSTLQDMHRKLNKKGSGMLILKGEPLTVLRSLTDNYPVKNIYVNRDYEPYGLDRDQKIKKMFSAKGISLISFKDHLIFEPGEVLKPDGTPYTVFTPFKKQWLGRYQNYNVAVRETSDKGDFFRFSPDFPDLEQLGFTPSAIKTPSFDLSVIPEYHTKREIPSLDATSRLGPHLRFGTLGIRALLNGMGPGAGHEAFLSELIWREFFMHILYHYPHAVHRNFRSKYDGIYWINDDDDFSRWREGRTGYPIVDAGMRELKQTGFMHNRVRMITAGFLCKHLLTDWRLGEAYFASRLLDYELASNNGNWQWAAGTGCDAAPYFRIFNPLEQHKKFDPDSGYVKKWVPELNTAAYPPPMIDHKYARARALEHYKKGIA